MSSVCNLTEVHMKTEVNQTCVLRVQLLADRKGLKVLDEWMTSPG